MPRTSKQIAYLEYTFIFDPKELWTTMQDFEYDFAKFLKQHSIQAEFVDNIMGDKKRIFHLYKISTVEPPKAPKLSSDKQMQQLRKKIGK